MLARHLRAQGVNTFRGSEQDVLSRMHGAAAAHGADLVVRVCADNPLIWGGEIDNLIRFYQREHTAGNCDYAYNHIPRNNLYPDGLGAEIVSFEHVHQGHERGHPARPPRALPLVYRGTTRNCSPSAPSTRSIRPCTIRK